MRSLATKLKLPRLQKPVNRSALTTARSRETWSTPQHPKIVKAVYQWTGIQTAAAGPRDDVEPPRQTAAAAIRSREGEGAARRGGVLAGFKTKLWALPVTRGYIRTGGRAAELSGRLGEDRRRVPR